MSRLLILAALMGLTACGLGNRPEPAKPSLADNLVPGCYTVDLFDPYRIEYPEPGVTPENAKFLGVWKDAAWTDPGGRRDPEGRDWCHDLYITEVKADGTVTLLDAYGPSSLKGYEAQVYKRTAKIVDGVLTFNSIGRSTVSYQIADDGAYLVGRRVDARDTFEITMNRTEGVAFVPIPPVKPTRRS